MVSESYPLVNHGGILSPHPKRGIGFVRYFGLLMNFILLGVVHTTSMKIGLKPQFIKVPNASLWNSQQLNSMTVGNCTVSGPYITLGNSFGVGHNSETNTSHVFTIGYKGNSPCSKLKPRILIKNQKGASLFTIYKHVVEQYTQAGEDAAVFYMKIERRHVEQEHISWSLVIDHNVIIEKQEFPQRHLVNPQRAHSTFFFGNLGIKSNRNSLLKKINNLNPEMTDLLVNLGEHNSEQPNSQLSQKPDSLNKWEDDYFTNMQPALTKVPFLACPGKVLGVDEPGSSTGHRLDLRFKMPNCLLTPNSSSDTPSKNTTDPDPDDPVDENPSAFYFDVQYKNAYYIFLDLEQIVANEHVDILAFKWANKIVELANKVHWIKWKIVVSQLPAYCDTSQSDEKDMIMANSCVFLHYSLRRYEELFMKNGFSLWISSIAGILDGQARNDIRRCKLDNAAKGCIVHLGLSHPFEITKQDSPSGNSYLHLQLNSGVIDAQLVDSRNSEILKKVVITRERPDPHQQLMAFVWLLSGLALLLLIMLLYLLRLQHKRAKQDAETGSSSNTDLIKVSLLTEGERVSQRLSQ